MESNQKISRALGLVTATLLVAGNARAISLDDIQLWAGSGTNRAALEVEWNSPEVFNNTIVPAPVATKTMVWGYRFNGTAKGTQMLYAILTADPKLYAVVNENLTNGTMIDAIGYNLSGNGNPGVVAGGVTNYFINGLFTNAVPTKADSEIPLNSGDLYWGGDNGPQWLVWTEQNDAGGFGNSPNRGSSTNWDPIAKVQGQWEYTSNSLDNLPLTNGSWIGFSVAAAGYDSNPNDAAYQAYNNNEQAPPSPDGTYAAYVCDTNDFAVQVISTNGIDPRPQYNQPEAVLGRPTLKFFDEFGDGTFHRTKIIEPPYWTDPNGSNVTYVVSAGGQITVKLGRKVYANPNHPYGADLIVFGNSFFMESGFVSDGTDLDSYDLGSSILGHPTMVSVSPDGTNWYAYNSVAALFPQNAYRWDETNQSWTDEELNPTRPLNPSVYNMNFNGLPAADELEPFVGSAGGTGYSLSESGFPWVQYVSIQPGAGTYTVIDAVAAARPAAVGDALGITPDNVSSGMTNLDFQSPNNCSQNEIAIGFGSVNEFARISTVSLYDFSPFAPVEGEISSAYQIQALPVSGNSAVAFSADVGLRAGNNYIGDGSDLRVFQWACTNWVAQPFIYNSANNEVMLTGVTNDSADSAFVISQIARPVLRVQSVTKEQTLTWTTAPNCPETLERSTNFANWSAIGTFTATNAAFIKVTDTNAPAGGAFYRVEVTVP
jgi:hypothetical protein